jgi:hypothetical protein
MSKNEYKHVSRSILYFGMFSPLKLILPSAYWEDFALFAGLCGTRKTESHGDMRYLGLLDCMLFATSCFHALLRFAVLSNYLGPGQWSRAGEHKRVASKYTRDRETDVLQNLDRQTLEYSAEVSESAFSAPRFIT